MCDICRKIQCDFRCPNYMPPKNMSYCSICDEAIHGGDEYIENLEGECIHYECIRGIRYLLEWLGHDIKTMEEMESI